MPRISLLAPSLNLQQSHSRRVNRLQVGWAWLRQWAGRGSGRDLQRAGCQVSVLVLQLAVQRQAALLPVVGQVWRQREDLAEGRAGRHQVTADRGRQRGRDMGHMRPRPGLGPGPGSGPGASSDFSPRLGLGPGIGAALGLNPGPGARPAASSDSIPGLCLGPGPGPRTCSDPSP